MRIGLITREYPPDVYGGAGVHVEMLSQRLRGLVDLDVFCFGGPRPGARAFAERDQRFLDANNALHVLSTDLEITAAAAGCDVVHSHTWYANLAGHLAKLLYDVPHVVTSHSLEPQRPWKAEQLGGGYRLSSWAERTAYGSADAVIAVSRRMAEEIRTCYPDVSADRLHVIHNGVDAAFYRPDPETSAVTALGIDVARPYAVFVGRITRQKGVPHLLRAAVQFDPALQVLLLAGAADTAELRAETDAAIADLHASRDGVVVVNEMLPRDTVRQALSHAAVFVCPSVYEPLGIVNLEAMACGTAVVASDVGGIPEVVVDGETGVLVHHDPSEPGAFEAGLATAVNQLAADPARARQMGEAGRVRAVHHFDWAAIARQTTDLYRSLT